jgi:hypothetical protein
MASNTLLNSGTGGDTIATKEVTLDGDTAKVQLMEVKHLTGSEGAYTANTVFFAEDAAHTSGDFGMQMLGVRTDTLAARAGASGDYTPFLSDANGALYTVGYSEFADDSAFSVGGSRVTVMGGVFTSDSIDSGDTGAIRLTATRHQMIEEQGTHLVADDAAYTVGTNKVAVMGGVVTTDSADSGDAAAFRVTATRSLVTAIANSSGTIIDPQVDDAAYTAGTSLVSVIGAISTSDSVDSGDAGALAMTLTRRLHVTPKADTAGGAPSKHRNIDANAETEVKATAGQLYWVHCMNLTAAKAYLHLYDAAAASVTPGTTVPDFTFPIPTQGDTNGAGFALSFGAVGQQFGTGITYVVTTTIDGSAGDPGTNGVFVNLGFF